MVSPRYVLHQRPVITALLRTAAAAMRGRPAETETPGPELTATVPPRSAALVRDYVAHVGGRPSAYSGVLPPHLYPQWGFPLMSRTLAAIPYDLRKVLNGGCRLEVNRPLPANEPLQLRACLESIDDNGRRAVLKQRLVTGTDSAPDALVAYTYAIVPLRKREPGEKKKEPKRVPAESREIGRWKLAARSGLDFALLTGDFNPVHWVRPYARVAGFKSVILHGFSTLARAIETLNDTVWSGDVSRLHTVDVQFVRPLVLPREVGVYFGPDGAIAVGDAPGGRAYLVGSVTTRGNDG